MGLKKIPSVILTIVVITSCLSFTTNGMYAQTTDEEDAKSSLNTNEWSEEEAKPADEQEVVEKKVVNETVGQMRGRELLKELGKNTPEKKGNRDKIKSFFEKKFLSKKSDAKTSTQENSVKEPQHSESATNEIKEPTPKVDKKAVEKAAKVDKKAAEKAKKTAKKAKKKAAELDKQLLGKIAQRRGALAESSDESGKGYLSTSEEEREKIAKSKNRPMPKEIKSEKKKKKNSSAKSIDVEFLPIIQESQLESSDLENEIIEKKTKQPFFSKAFEKIKGAGSWALDKLDKNPGVKKAIVDQSAGFIDQLLTKKSSDESGTVQKEQVKEPAVAQKAPLKPARQAFSSNNPTSKESNSESSVNANIAEYITLIPQNSLGERHNEMSTKIDRVLYAIDSEMPSPPPSSDEEEIAKINRQSSVDSDSSVSSDSSDSSYYFRPSKLPRLQGFASPAHKQNFKSIHKPLIRGNIPVLVPSHANTMKLKPMNNARNFNQLNILNHAPAVSTNQGSSKGTLQKQIIATQVRVPLPLPNSKMSSQKQINKSANTTQNNNSVAQVSGTTDVDKSLNVKRNQSAPAVLAPPVVLKEDLSKEEAEKKSNLDEPKDEKKVEAIDPVKYSDLKDDSLDEKSEKVLVKSTEDEKAQETSGSNTILIISILAGSVIALLIFIKILNVRKLN
ncbi:actin assembly-inducing protein ActA [Listeria seeligeri]|uniref:actin assembly-inducing protein ActA n=1 Tax=Listeria seeligeri TaxID=1640 RepID=UPI0016294CBD|nr:actin assembly-inducing protein ActA [Listeria seeligeri]MBC1577971.1 actin assembly-inducing protein ActA [Listeria seeligeri]MBC1586260.1 actin assembly-inducing protein ActA [Listeria seeligeri]MBC1593721.1 actin assembly-inducing protein ActA [Listeria seeligeri]MBC1916578.1 actin assembly-inducing protein ActA [Listeria seeligeri]MBC1991115.1 actin assembly-inducing protein ActA [Listeria seeligeri]